MTVRPILFSGPMVRALIAGTKTQTRRILKLPKWASSDPADIEHDVDGKPLVIATNTGCLADLPLPYASGDLIWVRETGVELCRGHRTNLMRPEYAYAADIKAFSDGDELRKEYGYKWKPSIHMPRWASRLTLDVTEVRVERLQEITKEDVIAEGISERDGAPIAGCVCGWHEPYAQLWDEINGCGAWDANPWIVALTLSVHRVNVDELLAERTSASERQQASARGALPSIINPEVTHD